MATKNRINYQIRCSSCDLTQPWDKRAVPRKLAGQTCVYRRCARCKRIHVHFVEKASLIPVVSQGMAQ